MSYCFFKIITKKSLKKKTWIFLNFITKYSCKLYLFLHIVRGTTTRLLSVYTVPYVVTPSSSLSTFPISTHIQIFSNKTILKTETSFIFFC